MDCAIRLVHNAEATISYNDSEDSCLGPLVYKRCSNWDNIMIRLIAGKIHSVRRPPPP